MINIDELYTKLLTAYGHQHWWPSNSPFETMVGAILTQNTNWSNVTKAIQNLGDECNPKAIVDMDVDVLAEKIRPSGYFNQKAERLKILATWFAGYNFDIEVLKKKETKDLRKELLSLKGVGPETADDMLVYVFDKPSFVIDTYTRRLFERLGYSVPKSYDDFRVMIEQGIPKDVQIYNEYHGLIVIHAKEHCQKKPVCLNCTLAKNCEFYQEK